MKPTDRSPSRPRIWIDLDNTPHVPFFEPIMAELERRGYSLLLTARDAFQVCELADRKGFSYARVGRHHGRNRLAKILGLFQRAFQLSRVVPRHPAVLAVSHGSRAQMLLANVRRQPSVLIDDYEFSRYPILMKPSWAVVPSVIPVDRLPVAPDRVRTYDGLKEDLYAWKVRPDPEALTQLGIDLSRVLVTVRPPATEAHYHDPESDHLFARFMDRATKTDGVQIVLLPRNRRQREDIEKNHPTWFVDRRTVIPDTALDGLNLVWHSDLVVSGGGTMVREAAALGVPAFSVFRGPMGAVDEHLKSTGRLVMITDSVQIDNLPLVRRPRRPLGDTTTASHPALHQVVDAIQEIAEACAEKLKS